MSGDVPSLWSRDPFRERRGKHLSLPLPLRCVLMTQVLPISQGPERKGLRCDLWEALEGRERPVLPPCWVSLVAQTVRNLPAVQEAWVWSWVRKIPWRKEWQPTRVFLAGELHGQRKLVSYIVHGVDTDTTEQEQWPLCWNCCFDLLFFAVAIIIIHNGPPQRILPLRLTDILKCLCSEACPPLDGRKKEMNTSPAWGLTF